MAEATTRSDLAGDGPGDGTIVCPECSRVCVAAEGARDADDFCPRCDYPLFWARPRPAAEPAGPDVDDARRRSPGASGATVLASVPCPACHELNLPAAWLCIRCDASMIPPLPPEPVPVPLPEPVPPAVVAPPTEPAEPFPWWWLAAMLVLATTAWAVGAAL